MAEPATKPETKEETTPETKAETKVETEAKTEAETKASSMVGELEIDIEIKSTAEQFHHMFVKRPHHVSKATPGTIGGVELHEGEWDKVGSIVVWNYIHGNCYFFYVNIILQEDKIFVLTLAMNPHNHSFGCRWSAKSSKG